MILAVDPSTVATGFAFGGVSDGVPRGGVWDLPGASNLFFDATLVRAMESVMSMAKLIHASRVVIECPLLVNDSEHAADTTMKLIQLTGAIRAGGKRAGCEIRTRAVSTIRKHFIGVGNLHRKEAKAAVMRRCDQLHWQYKDDNQADANALWCFEMSNRYPQWAPNGTPLFAKRGAA